MNKQKNKASKRTKMLALIGAAATINCAFAGTSVFDKFSNGKIIGDSGTNLSTEYFNWVETNGNWSLEKVTGSGTDAPEQFDFGVNFSPIKNKETAINDSYTQKVENNFVGVNGKVSVIWLYKTVPGFNIIGNFIGNNSNGYGVIRNDSDIGDIVGDFVGNHASSGHIIRNGKTIETIKGDFLGNDIPKNLVIGNSGKIGNVSGNFIGNNGTTIGNSDTMGILADFEENVVFKGNSGSTTYAFAGIANFGTIELNSKNGSKIVVNDTISDGARSKTGILNINSAKDGFSQKMDGEFTGNVEFNNSVINQTVNVLDGTLKLGSYKSENLTIGTKTITTKNSIAKLKNSTVTVSNGARLQIGADETASDLGAVSFDANSTLKLESGSTLAFEQNSTLEFLGTAGSFDVSADQILLDITDAETLKSSKNEDFGNFEWLIFQATDADVLSEMESALKNNSFDFNGNELSEFGSDLDGDGWFYEIQKDLTNGNIKIVGVIPEPATLSLIGVSGLFAYFFRRRFS